MSVTADIGLQLGTLDLQVEFEVKPGELVALLGPNGAGKSTVLRCLAGLAVIDAGRITIDQVAVDDPAEDIFVEAEDRSVGVVFQSYLLFEHMSVLENVAYGLRARKHPKAEARRIALGWLQRVGLEQYANERPRALSGGQAQRAALARALATDPRLLLLDEPLAALDAGTRATVRRDLRRHLETFDGMCILVTHDPVDAYALADRVAILDAGRIVQLGSITEVTARPRSKYIADLVGVNLIAGTAADGMLISATGTTVAIAESTTGPAFVVIRPQSITISLEAPTESSARNVWQGTIADIDRLGDRVRVKLDGAFPLTAEITSAALGELELRPGDDVFAAVKATDVDCYLA